MMRRSRGKLRTHQFEYGPLLEWTGLYAAYTRLAAVIEEWWNRDLTEKRRSEVERKARRARYKRLGREDPRLPKIW